MLGFERRPSEGGRSKSSLPGVEEGLKVVGCLLSAIPKLKGILWRYGESVERMSFDELEQGKKWLSDTFYLISINWVLGLAKAAVLRHGVNGLIFGPMDRVQVAGTIGDAFLSYNSAIVAAPDEIEAGELDVELVFAGRNGRRDEGFGIEDVVLDGGGGVSTLNSFLDEEDEEDEDERREELEKCGTLVSP
ncbi:hypothetical protein LOK49_LG01G04184 [Camellia lanceoleosa]|uniref:Uncharacterized protein n=1 Tax=Camellia lanceoleosa TaxID=1840588 RepID=A0ACC0IX40_9ERIC|nr:hypothetical protein LOK49_LG01G04184 [Camellia lanceoleosa]